MVNVDVNYFYLSKNKSKFGDSSKWTDVKIGSVLGCFVCQIAQSKFPSSIKVNGPNEKSVTEMLVLDRTDVIIGAAKPLLEAVEERNKISDSEIKL